MSEIAAKAAFDHIRYAQLWEDAEVLVDAIGPRPGGRLVSICSAGDNALAMLLCAGCMLAGAWAGRMRAHQQLDPLRSFADNAPGTLHHHEVLAKVIDRAARRNAVAGGSTLLPIVR